ncbi:MAG: hypothetical protein H6700_06225 [Myxococcales bacterium]|nr:hypothetical protein [Myxococcales bacterium]
MAKVKVVVDLSWSPAEPATLHEYTHDGKAVPVEPKLFPGGARLEYTWEKLPDHRITGTLFFPGETFTKLSVVATIGGGEPQNVDKAEEKKNDWDFAGTVKS